MLRDKSKVLGEELQLLGDDSLLARNKVHAVKKETHVLRNKSLLVKDGLHKIRKEAQLLKNKLLLSRNKLHDVKKETEVFKDESEKRKKARINQIIAKLEKRGEKINQINVKSEKLLQKSNDSTKISKLQKLRDEVKKHRDEAKPYMNKAKKYRDEILKLVGTSKASSKACIDTSKIINTDKDSIDEKITEEIVQIKKDNRLAIFQDTKPNIKINKKTSLKVFKIVRNDIENERNWEKRKITWVFWKSHVSELCEKWICSKYNYAYTRFEEFRTCSGEVLFTNEHKAVFSKNEAGSYIDINDLEIFKDFSSDSKIIFKIRPITAEIIKLIITKKDTNIKDSCLKKIEEYTCIIENMYNSLQNSIYKIYDNQEEIYDLYSIYYNLSDAEKNRKDDILKKIDEIQNNSFDMIWNIVYKEIKRGTGKVKTDKEKNIYKYLQELQKIVNDNDIELSDTRSDVRSLIAEISDRIGSINKIL